MRYFLGLLLLFLLSGCAPYTSSDREGNVLVSAVSSSGTVQEITLKDGTRCAVLVGYSKGAISCNWKSNPKE